MPTIRQSIAITGSTSDLFRLSQDYGLRLKWDPFLTDLKFLNGATKAETGTLVWVKSIRGLAMTVKYITVRAPELVAMRMTDGPKLFRTFAGSWSFREMEDGRTLVTFNYHFNCAGGWLRHIVNWGVKYIFQKDMRQRLAGLKYAAEKTDLLRKAVG